MNDDKELQRLIERAWGVHDSISHEIKSNVSCRSCSGHGPETPIFDQRQSLLHIRDSLKEVKDMLISLQRMRSWQLMEREAAIGRLEESRAMLVEKVTLYRETGREVSVVEELDTCLGNLEEKRKKKERVESCRGGFVMFWVRRVLNPWKWRKGFGVGMKVMLVLATISSCSVQARKWQSVELQRRSNLQRGRDFGISSRALDVFDGRG